MTTASELLPLSKIARCFGGLVPGAIATCDADGLPNVSYLSHVQLIDDRHLAVSCQFFNKTRRNLDESPLATVEVHDPVTFQGYRIGIRFLRSETEGALFESMSARIEMIASHTGMKGIFKLRSADVFEVLSVEEIEGFLEPLGAEPLVFYGLERGAPVMELHRLQMISDRINRAGDLDSLLSSTLAGLEELFGFRHAMVLVPEEGGGNGKLITLASRGYGEGGIGAEVPLGDGLIGTAAQDRRVMACGAIDADLRYGRAVRDRARQVEHARVAPEIPLPGLPDARSQLAIPLLVEDRLLGVLALESRDASAFQQWHECFLQVIGNQIASRMDHLAEHAEDDDDDAVASAPDRLRISMPIGGSRTRTLCFYKNDDCVFVDGEYLIRNVPGKILWKLLTVHARERRTEYSNRELRLDPWLGLPPIKDNLESRLILLRKRLEQKCPDIRLVPTSRGRFALELECAVELIERESA